MELSCFLRHLAGMASLLMALSFASDAALACACCSNRASRNVGVERLDGFRLHEIEQMNGVFFLSKLSRLKRDMVLKKARKLSG